MIFEQKHVGPLPIVETHMNLSWHESFYRLTTKSHEPFNVSQLYDICNLK